MLRCICAKSSERTNMSVLVKLLGLITLCRVEKKLKRIDFKIVDCLYATSDAAMKKKYSTTLSFISATSSTAFYSLLSIV